MSYDNVAGISVSILHIAIDQKLAIFCNVDIGHKFPLQNESGTDVSMLLPS